MCVVLVFEDDTREVLFVVCRGASLKLILGRLVGICGEVIVVVRFDCLCMFFMLVEFDFNNASRLTRGDGVACASKYLDSAFLLPDSL